MHESLRALARRGWIVQLGEARELLNAEQRRRYRALPQSVDAFLAVLRECHSPGNDAWFFGPDHYACEDPHKIRWDECERISLDAFADDPLATRQIQRFWDGHFPFMMASHSDYDYLAIQMGADSAPSAVVHGFAPEFEDAEVIAPSFDAFLEKLARAAGSDKPPSPFDIFLGMT